ncbi:MAG TPA: preprotein translocase subunit SecG [Firmicutes bacterium]|jgi:preprotein translocase subunit SecG|nr:preprotein translocase subunit SecG [Bacillota bacterium]
MVGVREVHTVLMVLFVIACLGLIVLVLLQSGKSAGLSIGAGAETFLGKKKGLNEKLAVWTRYIAAAFMVLALLLAIF